MTNKDKILLKIANTIVANLGNTTEIGLMTGKTGISLFLYEYARFSGVEFYEDIANNLLEDVFHELKPSLPPSIINGTPGIGWAIITMLKNGFIEYDDNELMEDIDKSIFSNAQTLIEEELKSSHPAFSVGLYLSKRLEYSDICYNEKVTNIVADIKRIINSLLINRKDLPKLFLASLYFVMDKLYSLSFVSKEELSNIKKHVLRYSTPTNVGSLNSYCAFENKIINFVTDRHKFTNISNDIAADCMPFDFGWWLLIYETYSKAGKSTHFVEYEHHLKDCFYDIHSANAKLSAFGLKIIKYD